MNYFDHDTEAYKDDKIVLLRRECGGAAIDAYWTLLEVIYRNETEIKPTENRFGFASVCFFLQVSEEQLLEWIEAMSKYGLLDVERDDNGIVSISSPRANNTIDGYKAKCLKNKENGSKGGRPSKKPVQAEGKTEPKPKDNPTKTEAEPNGNPTKPKRGDKEKEKEKEKENINPQTPYEVFDDIDADDYASRFAEFSAAVLEMYNAETNDGIMYFDGNTWQGLRRSFDAGRTVEDLRLVVRDKIAEWENDQKMRRFIRPSTLFGEKFESYLAKARKAKAEAGEFDEYE